ncbi:hypothetical protein B9Z55_018620 [Caenorhabditis nigoni]|uniref:Uncharacterized protein n=1 Tax=Caenorhabditis nigoni TaxID=1611254 RepID=A0A2G5TF15_9PELO|nr:hypothetical protein B9Z55_018620 [Caenorhabditis nigoni]
MTYQPLEVQKACLASQTDQWTTGHFNGLARSQQHSVSMLSPTGEDQASGRDNPVTSQPSRSSTLDVKTVQVKQTGTMRRSTRPKRSVKRVWLRNLLMTVVEIRMNSCQRILSNGYNSCVSRTPEVVVTSLNVTQRTDDG